MQPRELEHRAANSRSGLSVQHVRARIYRNETDREDARNEPRRPGLGRKRRILPWTASHPGYATLKFRRLVVVSLAEFHPAYEHDRPIFSHPPSFLPSLLLSFFPFRSRLPSRPTAADRYADRGWIERSFRHSAALLFSVAHHLRGDSFTGFFDRFRSVSFHRFRLRDR